MTQTHTKTILGRIVHFICTADVAGRINQLGGNIRYVAGKEVAAMVVGTHDETCNLTLFPDGTEGTLYLPNVGVGTQPGTWNWPEGVEPGRVAA